MRRVVLALVALLSATPALAAPLTDPVQSDAGQPGDAPAAFSHARALPSPGAYRGEAFPVDDPADSYALDVARDVRVVAAAPTDVVPNLAKLELVDPDGVVIAVADRYGGHVLTDVAGAWKFRVSTTLGARYTLDARTYAVVQDDGGSRRDAGFRDASALEIRRDATSYGNLSAPDADCVDRWKLPVAAGERVEVRFAWAPYVGLLFEVSMDGAKDRVREGNAQYVHETATATKDATWTFTLMYGVQTGGACGSQKALYTVHAGEVSSAPEPEPEPTSSPPELFRVDPAVTRPGKIVEIVGRNLSGAAFELGGKSVPVRWYAPDGQRASVHVPLLAPGHHHLVAAKDGATDVLENATEILLPADVAVVDVRVRGRAPPEGLVHADPPLERRVVEVEVANLAWNLSEAYLVETWIVPRGLPHAGNAWKVASFVAEPLDRDEAVVHEVVWDARGAVGSFDVVAFTRPSVPGAIAMPRSVYDADASNDDGATEDYAFVAPGVGFRPPVRLP